MGLKWLLFSNYLTSPRIWNLRIGQDGEQIQIEALDTFLMVFGASTIILFIIEVKMLVLKKLSYRPPNYVHYWA